MIDSTQGPYDVIVIGGGPGGYVCAIKAAQAGLRVACVDKRPTLGGTCLNVGCIPSKALLQSSHLYHAAATGFAPHGIKATVELDLAAMMARKDKVVDGLTRGIAFLFKKNKVDRIQGAGRIGDAATVVVDGKDELKTRAIVIATGSTVAPLAGVDIDEERIVSSTGALALTEVPKRLAVIGGGVIGLELGSVWQRLGSEVTVIEYMDTVLPGMDGDVCHHMQRTFKKQGLTLKLAHKVASARRDGDALTVVVGPRDGGDTAELAADVVLVAVGRRPCTEGLGLEEAGVALSDRGFVVTDDHFRTSLPGVYAIGDVIGGPMLAHKAEEEGVAVAEILAGGSGHVNYAAIPAVVYTWPEVAAVGATEPELQRGGIAYAVGKFPFSANSRALASGEADGFVKVLSDARTDTVLGVHIVGPHAGELIQEAVLAMEFGASAEDLARTCHAHPGFGEAVKEAAMAAWTRAIHV